MNNLKVSTRLVLLIGVLSLLLVAIGGLGLFGIAKSNAALQSVYEDRTLPTAQLGDIESMLITNRLALTAAMLNPTAEMIATSSATVEANIAAIDKLWQAVMATQLTPRRTLAALPPCPPDRRCRRSPDRSGARPRSPGGWPARSRCPAPARAVRRPR